MSENIKDREFSDYLNDILEAIDDIQSFTEHMSFRHCYLVQLFLFLSDQGIRKPLKYQTLRLVPTLERGNEIDINKSGKYKIIYTKLTTPILLT